MKKRLAAFFTIMILAFSLPVYAQENLGPVTARQYVVIDADSGQVLAEKGSDVTAYPASITKIMTLALALTKCGGDMSAQVTVSKADTTIEPGSSHIALQEGEVISLADAFAATMLMSANDAANVLAAYTAGSLADFPNMMNEQAAAIGMTGTHFTNAHGLYNPEHYTTAIDMSRLTRWALTVPGFKELFASTEYTMAPTNKQSKERLFGTDNCMLVENKYQYEGTIGGKSGWTQESGYTMVEACERSGRRLIAVVLASSQKYDKFKDCIALFDYCFANYVNVTVDGQSFGSKTVPVYGGGNQPIGNLELYMPSFTVILPKGQTAENLDIAYNIPEKYIVGQPFVATANISSTAFSSEGASSIIASVTLSTDSLGEILARSTGVANIPYTKTQQSFPWNIVLICVGGIVLAAIALLGGRIAYVAFIKAQRKKRKLERLRVLYGYDRSQEVAAAYSKQAMRQQITQRNVKARRNVNTVQVVNGGQYYQRMNNMQQRSKN